MSCYGRRDLTESPKICQRSFIFFRLSPHLRLHEFSHTTINDQDFIWWDEWDKTTNYQVCDTMMTSLRSKEAWTERLIILIIFTPCDLTCQSCSFRRQLVIDTIVWHPWLVRISLPARTLKLRAAEGANHFLLGEKGNCWLNLLSLSGNEFSFTIHQTHHLNWSNFESEWLIAARELKI